MNGNAYLGVEKVLACVDEGAVNALGESDIFFTFPAVLNGKSKTRLVLKKPKTDVDAKKTEPFRTLFFWHPRRDSNSLPCA